MCHFYADQRSIYFMCLPPWGGDLLLKERVGSHKYGVCFKGFVYFKIGMINSHLNCHIVLTSY